MHFPVQLPLSSNLHAKPCVHLQDADDLKWQASLDSAWLVMTPAQSQLSDSALLFRILIGLTGRARMVQISGLFRVPSEKALILDRGCLEFRCIR